MILAYKFHFQKYVFLVLALGIFDCQTEIPLPEIPYNERVIIQGVIEPDSVPLVRFNRTVPYLSGTTDPGKLVIRDASISVHGPGESDHLKLDSTFLPMDCRFDYFYKGTIKATRNTTYTLEILHGSKTYTASTTTALTPVTIDSVSYTPAFKDLYGEHEGVITYFNDINGEKNHYRFEMLRAADVSTRDVTGNNRDVLIPCLEVGDTIMFREIGRSVYSDKNLKGQQIKLIIEPALTHLVEVVIFVRIQTIDKATYDFYDQLDGQKLAQYNPFVEPVFIMDGQFGKNATGFFGSLIRSEPVRFLMPLDD